MNRERSCISISLWIGLAAVYIIFASTTASRAQEKIKLKKIDLGKVSLLPQLGYTTNYDEDEVSESDSEKIECMSIFTPSIGLNYKGSRPENYIRLNYAADLVAYSDLPENNYQTQKPHGEFGYRTPSGFYFKGSNFYTKTADPNGSLNNYGLGERIKRRYNKAEGLAGWEFGQKYSVEGFITSKALRYYDPEDKLQDRNAEIYGINFVYDWTRETDLMVRYRRTKYDFPFRKEGASDIGPHDFSSGRTLTEHSTDDFFVGAAFNPLEKLEGEIKVGYTNVVVDYEFGSKCKRREKDGFWAAETALSCKPMERTRLSMDFRRSYSGFSNAQDATFYIDSTSGLDIEREFERGIFANFRLAYSDWNYRNEPGDYKGKSFDIYTLRLGLDWEINEYITTGLNCQYKRKDANKDIFEDEGYTKKQVTAYVEGRY